MLNLLWQPVMSMILSIKMVALLLSIELYKWAIDSIHWIVHMIFHNSSDNSWWHLTWFKIYRIGWPYTLIKKVNFSSSETWRKVDTERHSTNYIFFLIKLILADLFNWIKLDWVRVYLSLSAILFVFWSLNISYTGPSEFSPLEISRHVRLDKLSQARAKVNEMRKK